MESWTNQMGFPLITLTREGDKIIATQDRFLLTEIMNHDLNITDKEPPSDKWYVPLSYFTDKDSAAQYVWMNKTNGKIRTLFLAVILILNAYQHVSFLDYLYFTNWSLLVEFNVPENIVWLKANVNQSGFYRVTYSEEMWMSIIAALQKNHSVFSPADRASLIDDVFTLCRYNCLHLSLSINFLCLF